MREFLRSNPIGTLHFLVVKHALLLQYKRDYNKKLNCYKLISLFSMVLKRNRKKRQNYLNSSKSHQGESGGRKKRLQSSRQKQMQMMKKKKMSLQVNSLPYVAV